MKIVWMIGVLGLALTGWEPAQATPHIWASKHHAIGRPRARRSAQHFWVEMREADRGTSSGYVRRASGVLHVRPSVDTRFGRGAVASFGYHPDAVAPTLAPHELNGAAEPQLGHSEGAAGVSVKVPL